MRYKKYDSVILQNEYPAVIEHLLTSQHNVELAIKVDVITCFCVTLAKFRLVFAVLSILVYQDIVLIKKKCYFNILFPQ